MKIELAKKIQEIIDAYKGSVQVHQASVQEVIEPFKIPEYIKRYTPDGLKQTIFEEIGAVIDAWKKIDVVYNQKLKAVIAEAKGQLLPMVVKPVTKPADYATKVSNALKYLELEGAEITDEVAYDYLKEFIDDYGQMMIFKRIIEKQVELEDANGNTTFPLTFGKLNKVKTASNTFNEIEALANMLFLYPKEQGQEVLRVNNVGYAIPMDSYEQEIGEFNIVGIAYIIDSIAEDILGTSIEN
jgi:hypothetical protein